MTHGLTSKWIYISRTVSNIGPLLHPLEERIRTKLIPALTGRPSPNDIERKLLALPSRLGGIGLVDPTETSAMEYSSSLRVAAPLIHLILAQDPRYPFEALEEQIMAKTEICREKSEQQSEAAKLLKSTLPRSLQRAVDLAQEKGASSWLTVLPLMDMGFCFHKSAFRDALALRYGWPPLLTPSHCACGTHFSVDHALSCPKGGFPSIRHNEIRDLTANLLSEVCSDDSIEPDLQPLTGEGFALSTTNTQDNGFWGDGLNVRILTLECLTPMLLRTNMGVCVLVIESMN